MADAGAAIAAFRRVTKSGEAERALSRIASEPQQKRAMEQFRKAITRAPDVKAALRDPRVLQVLATALGLPAAASQPGLATRALLSDLSDPKSLANRLADTRWKYAAQTLNLARGGLTALRDPAMQDKLAEGLRRAQWNTDLEAEQPGLGDAVLFADRAADVNGSVYNVLGNTILRRVVTGALGLPESIAIQSVETQARAVTSRYDLKKLDDPREVRRLTERYLLARASSSATTGTDLLARYGFPTGGLSA